MLGDTQAVGRPADASDTSGGAASDDGAVRAGRCRVSTSEGGRRLHRSNTFACSRWSSSSALVLGRSLRRVCAEAPTTGGGKPAGRGARRRVARCRSTSASPPTSTRTTRRSPRARRSSRPCSTASPPSTRSTPTKVVPAAAETWEPNADATVWTFKLNKNGKFADGTPVKAQDFVYAWNRIANPKTVNTSTKKADPSVIELPPRRRQGLRRRRGRQGHRDVRPEGRRRLHARGHADVRRSPTSSTSSRTRRSRRCRRSYVEGGVDYNGTKVAFGDMPVGNGPFKMAEPWKHNQYIKVVANDNYYGDKPLHRRHRVHDLQGPGHRLPRVRGRQPRLHPDR